MTRTLLIGTALLSLTLSSLAVAQSLAPFSESAPAGILDEPLINPNTDLSAGGNQPASLSVNSTPALLVANPNGIPGRDPNLNSDDPVVVQQAVQNAVEKEIEDLEALPIVVVEDKAKSGERAAQVVIGNSFAAEAQSLTGFTAAANQAAEDAVRWYSLAARRGYPGAVSLDYAGVSFYPVRVQRARN